MSTTPTLGIPWGIGSTHLFFTYVFSERIFISLPVTKKSYLNHRYEYHYVFVERMLLKRVRVVLLPPEEIATLGVGIVVFVHVGEHRKDMGSSQGQLTSTVCIPIGWCQRAIQFLIVTGNVRKGRKICQC